MKKAIIFLLTILCALGIFSSAAAEGISVVNTSVAETVVAPIEYDPSPAKPGQLLTLYIKVENPSDDPIRDARYKLEPEYPFSLEPGEKAIKEVGTMLGHQQIQLEYDLIVDRNALEGTYDLFIWLCTNEDCTTGSKKRIEITVKTGGVPKVEVGLESADIFSAGKTGSITLHIINRGLLDAKYVMIELMPTQQFDLISPGRIYIGELESDDFETAEFQIYIYENVATNTSQRIRLPVQVEYSDANDKEYSESKSTYLKVYSPADLKKMGLVKEDNTLLYIGAIVILAIIGYLGYRFYKKRSEE